MENELEHLTRAARQNGVQDTPWEVGELGEQGIDVWQYFGFLQSASLGKVSQSLAKLGANLEHFWGCASCVLPT